jgi:hypothetical protein
VTTGTCVDISHLLAADGSENGVEDEKVKMQGLESYNYSERVTRTAIFAAQETQQLEAAANLAKREKLLAARTAEEDELRRQKIAREKELEETNAHVISLWESVKDAVNVDAKKTLAVIAKVVGPKFVVAGFADVDCNSLVRRSRL